VIHPYRSVVPSVHPSVWVAEESLIAAGTLVAPGTKIPPRSMVMGAPARVKREVSVDDLDLIRRSAQSYITLKNDYLAAVRTG
jgi:carbonic anhydrase/acetyltransferase-like protein (isoleucine patch superfamily)